MIAEITQTIAASILRTNDHSVEQNYQMVGQLLETADELANQANVLNEPVARFRTPEV